MQFVFVMDPAETMLPDKDTSFALIRSAEKRGHHVWHCLPRDVYVQGSNVGALARPLSVSDQPPHVTLGNAEDVPLARVDAVFIRKDPPFDVAYSHLTRLLDLVKGRTLVLNDPQALRDANEKLFALRFERFMPRTLVASSPARLLEFLRHVGGRGVLKPLDGAGGSGVVGVSLGDKNTRALIDLLTDEGKRHAILQEFQPAVTDGDKRVLVLDGKPLGAILRVPREDDIRANIHVGGNVQPTELGADEVALVTEIGPELAARGLWFAGLDLIGGKLIEINVTSPTGIQELGRFQQGEPEADVIAWVERRARALGG